MTKQPLFGREGLFSLAVIVSALGYFVDVYDIVLFSTVRIQSLTDLGIPEDALFSTGVYLLNLQMAGMLAGGFLWGIIGDKSGRLTILFGSILIYSLANIGNAFVTTVDQYAILRFISGFGLAGEIGGAVTLVSETMRQDKRGLGTTLIAGFGLTGAIVAGIVAKLVDWRTAYIIGGVLGLVLLALRVKAYESGLFETTKKQDGVSRGNLLLLIWPPKQLIKYLSCAIIGVPLYFIAVIFMVFAPELTKSIGVTPTMPAESAVIYIYSGIAIGALLSGFISQWMGNRKKVLSLYLVIMTAFSALYLFLPAGTSLYVYKALTLIIGFTGGYVSIFFMISAEQFGTNIRALAVTSITNFIRAATIPIASGYIALKSIMSLEHAALTVGAICLGLAFLAITRIDETFDRDLDYVEEFKKK